MPRIRISQMTATNPLNPNSIANVPLQAGTGQFDNLEEKKLLPLLENIADPNKEIDEAVLSKVQEAMMKNEKYADSLRTLLGALQNNTASANTSDPITGEKYKNGHELARELAKRVREESNMDKNANNTVFNLERYAQRVREDRKKKKTRGNPFRVLMGKIGKLLDHGLGKRDIVRYIGKENIWDDETIDKAVDVVMEYNKKKRKEEKKFQKTSSEGTIKTAARDADKSIYEFAPDFEKRSTSELMARASWLNDLQSYNEKTPQGDGRKAANKDGIAAELKLIRAALKKRGFEPNEIP